MARGLFGEILSGLVASHAFGVAELAEIGVYHGVAHMDVYTPLWVADRGHDCAVFDVDGNADHEIAITDLDRAKTAFARFIGCDFKIMTAWRVEFENFVGFQQTLQTREQFGVVACGVGMDFLDQRTKTRADLVKVLIALKAKRGVRGQDQLSSPHNTAQG